MKAEVIIVGAGAAGLAAASYLKKNGISPLVLEARGRLGGRVYSKKDPETGLYFELGAEFIHERPQFIYDLIEKNDFKTFCIKDSHYLYENFKFIKLEKFWESLQKIIKDLKKNGDPEKPMADYFDSNPNNLLMMIGQSYIEGFHGADLNLVGQGEIIAAEDSAHEEPGMVIFENGYSQILSTYLEEAAGDPFIKLNTPVSKIEWKPGKCHVYTNEQIFECKKVILTVPISVFKSNGIVFSPRLAEKEELFDNIEMGSALRITLAFSKNIWSKKMPEMGGFLHNLHSNIFPTWWMYKKQNYYFVSAWVGGIKAMKVAELSDENVTKAALDELSAYFDFSLRDLKKYLENSEFHNWQTDPYSLGGYSYIKHGGLEKIDELQYPVMRTLFFAGEAMATQTDRATVQGAIKTGELAAQQLLEAWHEETDVPFTDGSTTENVNERS